MHAKASEPLILDVRPVFQKGGSPCELIDNAVASLKDGQTFVLLVPFQPLPLYAKLAREGFVHREESMDGGDWRVEFHRKNAASIPATPGPKSKSDQQKQSGDIHLDTRQMEPPEPLVCTLEALTGLKPGNSLSMQSLRKPLHLFEQLEARALAYDCTEQADHSFITRIWHSE